MTIGGIIYHLVIIPRCRGMEDASNEVVKSEGIIVFSI